MVRRVLIAGVLAVIGLPVVLIAAVLVVANTDWGRAWIADAVQSATAEGPVQVRIGKLTGPIPTSIGLQGLRLADRSGVFAEFDRVDLAWSPLALLGGTVAVDAIGISGGRVLRAPDLPEGPAAQPEPESAPTLAFPAPPVAVRVAGLSISDLELGRELAGREATIAADLSASLTDASAGAKGWLTAATPEGTARLDLDLAVVPSDGTMRAELRVSEPEGGLVAGTLGLPERPPLDLNLTGSGTLADWKGQLAGGFGRGAEVDFALTVASSEDGTRLGADGTAAVQRLLPDVARPLVGPTAGLAVSAMLAPDGAVSVDRLSVRTAAASVDGGLRIDPAGIPVAADIAVSAPDLGMLSAIAGTDLAGGADLRAVLLEEGRRARVTLTGSPMVAGTALDGLTAELSAGAERPLAELPETLDWSLDASVDTPDLVEPEVAALLGPRLALQASGAAGTDGADATVDRLVFTTDVARVEAGATLSDGRKVEMSGTARVPDLEPLSTLAGRPLAGAGTLTVDGTVLLDPLDVAAVVEVSADALDLGDPALAALVGPSPSLGAGVALDAANRLSIHGLTLQAASLSASGDADLDLAAGSLDGRLALEAPDLAAAGPAAGVDLAGSAAAELVLGGTLESPTASASWRAAPLVVQGTTIDELTGSATAAGLPSSPSGRLELRADAVGETVTLGAGYALDGETLTVSDLALDGAGLRARGGAAIDLAAPGADGELTLSAQDLGRLGAVAGLPLSGGSLETRLRLDAGDGQAARLSGTVKSLALDGGATEVAEIELSGDGRNLLSRPAGTLRATVGRVRQDGGTLVERASLTAESDGTDAQADVSVTGEAGMPFTVSASASAALGAEPLRVTVEALDAELRDVRVALQRPTVITLGPPPTVENLVLSVDGGRISGGGRVDPQDLDFSLAVRDLPAELARLADPTLQLTGGIAADLAVSGPLGDPTARLAVSVPELRSADPALADVPPLRASAEVRVQDRTLTASLDAAIDEDVEASLRASAGLLPGAGGAPPSLDEGAPMQARLDAEALLERLSAFLPLDGGQVGGQASVHVAVAGTPADPDVSGTAVLRDGLVDHPTAGLYLRDIRLEARGRAERLEIETMTASAVGGGTLEGSGGISFDVAEGAPADFRLVANQLQAVDTDVAEVALDADLAFQGALPEYRLSGTITVLPSEIRIPSQLPPSVVELSVTEVRDGVVVRSPEQDKAEEEEEGENPVVLDMTVAIPGQVFIRGRGLDSEWGGELKVTGRADDPQVNGALEVRRGQLGAVGRTFEFQRGRVVFDGGPPDDPTLDMVLATEVAEIEARVEVSGSAQDPAINLTSEPALPEEEVLSRILFGSPRAQLSPLQAVKLAQSAAVLSGQLGSGGGFTDSVRETLGVDTLDVETGNGGEGSRGASLSVGKYVAPGVFLKLQQGLSGADSKAVVEVELTDSISVETDVGAGSQSRVGVNWSLDY